MERRSDRHVEIDRPLMEVGTGFEPVWQDLQS